ncbi:efflux RND transporter periplasmic adaptor subunit [Arcticibacter sp. MXS-1]|uniref:efflux RND transporter periplasmic adaptor subunit n=1 Tax=Arcticibacter sp. MXS-1 TaxID=3341726 RepID=UPI0035A9426F
MSVLRFLYAVLILSFLASCNSSGRKEGAASDDSSSSIPVTVTRARDMKQPGQLLLSGSVEAFRTVDLSFSTTGTVQNVYKREGQAVAKGELLATLNPESYSYSLKAATATLDQAQDQYNRALIMKERGSLTPVDYQKALTSLQQAQAAKGQAQKAYNDTRLRSPISGVVSEQNVEPGENAAPGVPHFTVVQIRPLLVKTSIPEREVSRVRKGQRVTVSIPALDQTVEGRITELGIVADPTTRAYTVKIQLDNSDGSIRPGMIANAVLSTGTSSESIMLPGEAILRDPNGTTYVYTVDSSNSRAYRRSVSIGNPSGSNIAIASGLNGKELIVTGGQQKLQNGSRVQILK